jgi:hypothetical protein
MNLLIDQDGWNDTHSKEGAILKKYREGCSGFLHGFTIRVQICND